MNKEILHELINRYEENIDMIYKEDGPDELFKWKAMKVWRDEWSKPDTAFGSFAERFNAARGEFSVFIDNSRMHPSTGVIKLWEKEPETVEHLFRDVLFADPHGDVSAVQDNMDRFLGEYEALLHKCFPKNWSFKQDRHSASVFLAMNDPDFNYVYKYREAEKMASYIEFGDSIGSGMYFSLPNYYKMCDEIVSALKEHDSLLEAHFSRLKPEHYHDQSLHLLAFDLMYCCRTYNFYSGITEPSVNKTERKRSKAPGITPEELAKQEEERLAKIDSLEQQISDLELNCDEYSDISLVGVQVSTDAYGIGTVVEQDINKIKVSFGTVEKTFVLNTKYSTRPRFEDDEYIVSAFTEYARIQESIGKLRGELAKLQVGQ